STSSTRFTGNIVRAGLNYHFGAAALGGSTAAGNFQENIPQAPPNWDGLFSGMNVGGAFGSPPVTTQAINVFTIYGFPTAVLASAQSQTGSAPVETGGVIGGAQIGY